MSKLTALRRYALKTDEELSKLPSSILFTKTDATITVFDLYPKSNSFHFLLLPRITSSSLPEHALANLRNLLMQEKETAQRVVKAMAADAKIVNNLIRDEMRNRFGFEWPIFMGFHAIRKAVIYLLPINDVPHYYSLPFNVQHPCSMFHLFSRGCKCLITRKAPPSTYHCFGLVLPHHENQEALQFFPSQPWVLSTFGGCNILVYIDTIIL